ncbi:hypothetical protein N9C70_05350, partial [Flavobacteriales bacterium]|nr:hypothetical protein [Flavobacteriales bacterium]
MNVTPRDPTMRPPPQPPLQLNLVCRLFFYHIFDIHRAVFRILNRIDAKSFGVEVIELAQFSLGPDDVRAAEQIARHGSDFSPNHVVAGFVIAPHIHPTNPELLALHQSDFKVNAVLLCPNLHRNCLKRQVTIIAVQSAQVDPLWVHEEPLFQLRDIIQVAPFKAQQAVQLRGRILGVPGEGDFSKVKLEPFVHFHRNAQLSFWSSEQAVARDSRIAVAFLPVVRS